MNVQLVEQTETEVHERRVERRAYVTTCLQLLAKGYRNKEVAAALNISEDTVLTHMKSSFLKLGVDDRTEAVVNAVRLGIAHLD